MKKHIVKNGRKIVGFVFYGNGSLKYAFGKPSQSNYIAFDCSSLDEGIRKINEAGNGIMKSIKHPEKFNWAEHNANLQIYKDYFDPDTETNVGENGIFSRQISCFLTEEEHSQLVELLEIAEERLLKAIKEQTNFLIRQNKAA